MSSIAGSYQECMSLLNICEWYVGHGLMSDVASCGWIKNHTGNMAKGSTLAKIAVFFQEVPAFSSPFTLLWHQISPRQEAAGRAFTDPCSKRGKRKQLKVDSTEKATWPASAPKRSSTAKALFPDSFLAYITLTPSGAWELSPKISSTKNQSRYSEFIPEDEFWTHI